MWMVGNMVEYMQARLDLYVVVLRVAAGVVRAASSPWFLEWKYGGVDVWRKGVGGFRGWLPG